MNGPLGWVAALAWVAMSVALALGLGRVFRNRDRQPRPPGRSD